VTPKEYVGKEEGAGGDKKGSPPVFLCVIKRVRRRRTVTQGYFVLVNPLGRGKKEGVEEEEEEEEGSILE